MLMRHAGAFLLFMITDFVRYISFTAYVMDPENHEILNYYIEAKMFWIVGSFISQVLLI